MSSASGYAYACIEVPSEGSPVCSEFVGRDQLIEHLRELYARSVENNIDSRIFVFAGSRLQVTGAVARVIMFTDGTTAQINDTTTGDPGDADHLLALADRVGIVRY